MNYSRIEEFIIQSSEYLNDYILEFENIDLSSDNYQVNGTLKNTTQKVKILKRRFKIQESVIIKFLSLQKALEDELIIADNIFLSEEEGKLFYYVVLPNEEQVSNRFQTIFQIIQNENTQIFQIFKKILSGLKRLHSLGIAHGNLNPKTLWYVDNENIMFTPPDFLYETRQEDSYELMYKAPELIFSTDFPEVNESCDIWSLGCIYAELFFTKRTIFHSQTLEEFIFKIDEKIGIPNKTELEHLNIPLLIEFMDKSKLLSKRRQKGTFTEKLPLNERHLFVSMLRFDPSKRIVLDKILANPVFASSRSKSCSPLKSSRISKSPNKELFPGEKNLSVIERENDISKISFESLDKETARFQLKSSRMKKPPVKMEFLEEKCDFEILQQEKCDNFNVGNRVNTQSSGYRDTLPKTYNYIGKENYCLNNEVNNNIDFNFEKTMKYQISETMTFSIQDFHPISIDPNIQFTFKVIQDSEVVYESRKLSIELLKKTNFILNIPNSLKNGNSTKMEIQFQGFYDQDLMLKSKFSVERIPLTKWISVFDNSDDSLGKAKVKISIQKNIKRFSKINPIKNIEIKNVSEFDKINSDLDILNFQLKNKK